jgi:hypothetical protein
MLDVLSINNGEARTSDGLFGLLRLLSISEQVAEHDRLLKDEHFPAMQYHPILLGGDDDFYFIDLKTGQIVQWYRGTIEGIRAENLAAFLRDFSRGVESGEYVVVPDAKGLVLKSDLIEK